MILSLIKEVSNAELLEIIDFLNGCSVRTKAVKTQTKHFLIVDVKSDVILKEIEKFSAIEQIIRVASPYKLVSQSVCNIPTIIDLGDNVQIGSGEFSIMAGPCAIENEKQVSLIVDELIQNNIKIMRGGVFKPRSSPYSFRGLGMEGLKMFYSLVKLKGIKIITEVMHSDQIEEMYEYVDIFQVGSRNSQNYNLLDALGNVDKPVMIKRAISGTLEELLQSAEYVFSGGNERILLCERGIRTYENSYRNTFDINAIPILKEKSHLPVIADPSHGIGLRSHIIPIALAATAAGADGLIVEMHPDPEVALSDASQTLDFPQFRKMVNKVDGVRKAIDSSQCL